jgi:hypothetical protein
MAIVILELIRLTNADRIEQMLLRSNNCVSRKIRKADLPWWPCEFFSECMQLVCRLGAQSTIIVWFEDYLTYLCALATQNFLVEVVQVQVVLNTGK